MQPLLVVDIGSNSVSLLTMIDLDDEGPVGPRCSTVVGLREGAGDDGQLSEAALVRLDAHLSEVAEDVAPGTRVVATGTSAVRDAPNRERVAAIVRRHLDCELIVLSGKQEGVLGYAGTRLAAPPNGVVGTLDVGGASTELAIGSGDGTPAVVSLDVGVVRSRSGGVDRDRPGAAAARALVAELRARFAAEWEQMPRCEQLIGAGGTCVTLAAIDLGEYQAEAVHGHTVSRATVARITDWLADLSLAERRAVPGLSPNRAPVMVVGAAIVQATLEVLEIDQMTTSERNLLDGIALAALAGDLRSEAPIS